MSSSPPFIDTDSAALDTDQILRESYRLAGLILLFAGVALVPFAVVVLFVGSSPVGLFLTFLAQLVLAVGTGVVLVYVVARGIQLADA